MPFIHPAIFWTGLAAVALPIIIHLLNRRRYRIRYWAAMKFLLESLRKNRRRVRLEEMILLLLRCLIIFMLALAIGRFTGCGAMEILPGGEAGSRTIVFVLDDSYSMGQKFGATSTFAAATTDLADQLKSLSKTDTVAILLTSELDTNKPFFGPDNITDVDSLVARLQTLKPSDCRVDLVEALDSAGKILDAEKGSKRLYLLSDYRKSDLIGRERGKLLRERFAKLRSNGVKIVAMDYGREVNSNLTLEALELMDRFVVANRPARLAISVRNNGNTVADKVEIKLTSRLPDGEDYREVSMPVQVINSISPGESKRVEFMFTPPEPAPAVIRAELPADDLPGDNVMQTVLDVKQAVNVLIVDGRPDIVDPTESESFFFRYALDPDENGLFGIRTKVITTAELTAVDFNDYDVVALLSVASFPLDADDSEQPYPQLKALEQYVRDGGGLVIFAGKDANLVFYNEQLYGKGLGLSPYKILPPEGDPVARKAFVRLDPKSLGANGIFGSYKGEFAALTMVVRFYAYRPVDETVEVQTSEDVKAPQVLARFTDAHNSPAVVTREFGKGTVVMFYTSANTLWNDWAKENIYVTMVYDMVCGIARPQGQRYNAGVRVPIVFDMGEKFRDAAALLRTPQFPAVEDISLAPVEEQDALRLRYERSVAAGIYKLSLSLPDGQKQEFFFARNIDPAEGEITPGGEDEIIAAFGDDDFHYWRRRTNDQSSGVIKAESDKEYWLWAIAAMMVFMAAETLLAQRFGHYS